MSKRSFILFPQDASWRIAALDAAGIAFEEVAIAPGASVSDIAGQVAASLDHLGGAGAAVTLAVPSSWCVAATLPTEDIPKIDRKAMLYRLEESLPAAVEDLVADFVMLDGRALGVCAPLDRLRPLVEALEARHLAVDSVTPAALLAAQFLTSERRSAGGSMDQPGIVLIGEAEQVNFILLESGKPAEWVLLPRSAEQAGLQLEVALMAMPQPPGFVVGLEVGPDWMGLFAANEPIQGEAALSGPAGSLVPGTLFEAAAGASAVRGGERPWIEFRRGPLAAEDRYRLHRRALNAALVSAAVFLLALAAALIVRGQRYDHEASACDVEMREKFHAAFPDWTVPPNVRAMLESEHRKRTAVVPTAGAEPGHATDRRSALETLQAVLGGLPGDLPVRIEKMSFYDSSFSLEGHVRAGADADVIASAARKSGLEVATPPLHRDPDGFWAFTVRGNRPGGAPRDQAAAALSPAPRQPGGQP